MGEWITIRAWDIGGKTIKLYQVKFYWRQRDFAFNAAAWWVIMGSSNLSVWLKHEPKDRKTCWPDGALIKIKMGIAHLFQWLWFLNELLPRLSGSKWGRGEYGLQICPLAGSAGSKLYYPGIRWGRGWQLRPQRAVNQKALCALPFALVFLPQDSWFPRVLTVLCFTLGSHLVSME